MISSKRAEIGDSKTCDSNDLPKGDEKMLEVLNTKVTAISEKYADLIDKRISSALQDELIDGTVMSEITNGVRMLSHITSTLERIDRIQRGNDAYGQ